MQENTLRKNGDTARTPLDFNHTACNAFLPTALLLESHTIPREYWQNFGEKNVSGLLGVCRGHYFPRFQGTA